MIHTIPANARCPQPSFVISSRGSWMPGSYDTERAARYAFRFTDAQLITVRDRRLSSGGDKPTTWEDLKAYRQELNNTPKASTEGESAGKDSPAATA